MKSLSVSEVHQLFLFRLIFPHLSANLNMHGWDNKQKLTKYDWHSIEKYDDLNIIAYNLFIEFIN